MISDTVLPRAICVDGSPLHTVTEQSLNRLFFSFFCCVWGGKVLLLLSIKDIMKKYETALDSENLVRQQNGGEQSVASPFPGGPENADMAAGN